MVSGVTSEAASAPAKRPIGRPRHFDDDSERRLILDAAYAVLRDQRSELTISAVLSGAGISTRAFYRHFESKDALLRAMYLHDAHRMHARVTDRLSRTATPHDAVVAWIDEVYTMARNPKRAERVAVLGTLPIEDTAVMRAAAAEAIELLRSPLLGALRDGAASGAFVTDQPAAAAELIAAATLHAVDLSPPQRGTMIDQGVTTAFCLAAVGA
jgi:AcrR family transcriptional regulator